MCKLGLSFIQWCWFGKPHNNASLQLNNCLKFFKGLSLNEGCSITIKIWGLFLCDINKALELNNNRINMRITFLLSAALTFCCVNSNPIPCEQPSYCYGISTDICNKYPSVKEACKCTCSSCADVGDCSDVTQELCDNLPQLRARCKVRLKYNKI